MSDRIAWAGLTNVDAFDSAESPEPRDEPDEFEGFDPSDGSGNDHGLKALHEEFLQLFTKDVEGALADSSLTLEDFVKDVEEARRDGLEERWDALEAATAVWFCEACWAALFLLDAMDQSASSGASAAFAGTAGNGVFSRFMNSPPSSSVSASGAAAGG